MMGIYLNPPDFCAHTFGSRQVSLNFPTVNALRISLAILNIAMLMYIDWQFHFQALK
jgi:hypothetical protein